MRMRSTHVTQSKGGVVPTSSICKLSDIVKDEAMYPIREKPSIHRMKDEMEYLENNPFFKISFYLSWNVGLGFILKISLIGFKFLP